jgi:hypothetical protein
MGDRIRRHPSWQRGLDGPPPARRPVYAIVDGTHAEFAFQEKVSKAYLSCVEDMTENPEQGERL